MIGIWWIRRDIRLHDNQVLATLQQQVSQIIPLFIIDPFFAESPYTNQNRWAFLLNSLRELDSKLQTRGSRLIVKKGDPYDVLQGMVKEYGVNLILAEEDYSSYAQQRDQQIQADLPLQLVGSPAIRPPGSVQKKAGGPYTVYTPFKKTWRGMALPRQAEILPPPTTLQTPDDIASDGLPDSPTLPEDSPFRAGEQEGRRRLTMFAKEKIYAYDDQRDWMAEDGTSQLSPYLRFGLVSARETAVTALNAISSTTNKKAKENAQVWLDELIWRDFYIQIMAQFPRVLKGNFHQQYDGLAWHNDKTEFEAWCEGKTGYPIVDAGMRQLKAIGWMHNRARMLVASFLVKDLLIDWRWGEKWFMQNLLDGDPASNNGGWQWAAGTGTDAAPYFRIFNPTTQSKKFDPDGVYIRRWVPELAQVKNKYIHEPSKMSTSEQKQAGCVLGQDYPEPIVNHKEARQRTLDAYKKAKNG